MTTETTSATELLEAWVDAETEVMNLQLKADEIGLSSDEWHYRMGLVEAAKAVSETAWEAYEAANFSPMTDQEGDSL